MGKANKVVSLDAKRRSGGEKPVGWPAPKRIDPEAVQFQPDPLAILSRPYPRVALASLYLIVVIVVGTILWATFATVDRVVVAHGKIATVQPLLVVQPLELGVIRKINVKVGDAVRAGEVLAYLDPTFASSHVTADRTELASLSAEVARLHAEIDGNKFSSFKGPADDVSLQKAIYDHRKAEYSAAISSYDANIGDLKAQIDANTDAQTGLRNRLSLVEEVVEIRKKLWTQKLGSLLNLDQSRLNRVELANKLTAKIRNRSSLEEKLKRAEADLKKYENNWHRKTEESFADASRKLARLKARLEVDNRRETLVELRAPADGTVVETARLSVGSVVKEAERLFTIAPTDSRYDVEAGIDSVDVARVHPGQLVHVKLDSLPYQRHGMLDGRLQTITEELAQSEQQNRNQRAGEARRLYFRARIALSSIHLKDVPDDFHLIPGMTTTSDIVVGKRTVISYIIDPIARVLHESLREP